MSADLRLFELAARQRGRVTWQQLRALGYSEAAIDRRQASGLLTRELPRVYRVGPDVPLPFAAEQAALLWAGDAALSDGSAAAAFSLTRSPDAVHITPLHANPGTAPGLVVHRRLLGPDDVTTRHGLAATTPIRTLADLAATCDEAALERAVGEAQIRRLVTDRQLWTAAGATRRGMPLLRAILADVDGFTRSEAERLVRRLFRDAGLPQPLWNAEVDRWEVDCLFRPERLVLEFDGYGPHRTRRKFENDAEKTTALAGLGLRVARATWRQLTRRPHALVANVAVALARG